MPKARSPRNGNAEVKQLRCRLAEAEETLAAIRSGEVDAIAVDGPHGRQIFTLQSAEQPYRILAEHMSEGAASLGADGTVLFCNKRLAQMLGRRSEKIVGSPVTGFFAEGDEDSFRRLLVPAPRYEQRKEMRFQHADGRFIPVLVSVKTFPAGQSYGFCLVATDLTELKGSEAEKSRTQDAARRLALIVTSSTDAIIAKDLDGIVASWNPGAEAIYGYTASEMIGQSIIRVVPPDRVNEFKAMMGKIAGGQQVRSYETVHLRKDGQAIHVSLSVAPVKSDTGKVVGVSTIARDITERKLAEEKLKEASLYTRNLIEASLDPLVTISRDGKITDVNEATEKVTGLSRQQLIGSDFSNYFTKPEEARRGYQEVFAKGFVQDYPLAIRHSSGRVTDVLYNASVFRNARGEVGGVFAAARDISARKRVEEELRLSRERLVLAQKAGHSGAFEWDIVNNINVWSPEIEALYGLAPGEFGGKYEDWEALVVPEDLAASRACIETSLKTGEFGGEWRIRRRNDGQIRWLTARAKVILDENGKPLRMIGVNMDVTERRLAEEQVRKAAHYARTLIEASLDPLVTIRKDGKISDVNQATEKITGVSRERLIGSDFSDYFTEPDKARLGYQQVFSQGSVRDYPLAIRNTSGAITDVLYNATLFTNQAGEVEGIFAAARDVTQIKAAEQEVRRLNDELEQRVIQRTAQLEAANKELEAFTYSVSHDLRAPLRHISGFSKILTEEFSSQLPAEAQHHLQRIEEGTRRMGLLVDDLLNLGRVGRRELSLQVAGLRSIVEEVIQGLEPDVGDRQVQWKIGNLPYVECDTALMKQVFQNLLSNAFKFTRPRAHSIIEVGQQEKDGASLVYVRDNGVGFSMKYADKLFGVFQRLHRPEDFEGTGVGLATVQRIIQKHGGRIWAEAELDKGATFYFTLGNSEKHETKTEAAVAGEMHA